jgi:Flp pilus assembly secretin CpaC
MGDTTMLTHGACKRFGLAVAILAIAATGWSQNGATYTGASQAIPGGRIPLQAGTSIVLNDVKSYEIADTGVVRADPGDDGKLILTGVGPGSTTLMVTKTGMLGIIIYEVSVTGVDIENLVKTLKAALGGIVGLQISQEGNIAVLQGDVMERNDGIRIDRQRQMHGGGILDLTRRAYLREGLQMLRDELAGGPYAGMYTDTQLNRMGDEVLVLRGTVFSEAQRTQLMGIAQRFFDDGRIVEQVIVDHPPVEIDIEVYSFDLGRLRSLGNNTLLRQISTLTSDGWTFQTGPRFDSGMPDGDDPTDTGLGPDILKHTLTYPTAILAPGVSQFLDAVNAVNSGANISKQHASVRSGQTATIKNITEENIIIESAFDSQLEQVTYGQTMEITPVLVNNDRFETGINIELSNLVGVTETSDSSAPIVGRRSLSSSFVTGQRETVILGGNKLVTSIDSESGTPFLAHIPIVNWFFRDKFNTNDETVQVFLMTLFTPTTFAARENAQSLDGESIKNRTEDQAGENKEFLRRRQRWEQEGPKTLFTGETRFD